jgi:hypothetical protein
MRAFRMLLLFAAAALLISGDGSAQSPTNADPALMEARQQAWEAFFRNDQPMLTRLFPRAQSPAIRIIQPGRIATTCCAMPAISPHTVASS